MPTTRSPDSREVIDTIQKHLIGDGFPIVFDLDRSHGAWIHDAVRGKDVLDFYTFFASLPLGFQHASLTAPESLDRLAAAAVHKPANSDAHTSELARFTETFAAKALPQEFSSLFFIEGGALAVENALKAAFDWKVRKNLEAGRGELGTRILHFREAFHGRSGYTMSLTNTAPIKTQYFPKFDWPRVSNPKLTFPRDAAEEARVARAESETVREIEAAFADHRHDIAGIVIEPIQGEGGDNHFRPEFFVELRRLADEHEALLIFDEVQTGFGITGTMWAFEHFVTPDVISFGKKAQVCGVAAGPRLHEVEDNVFRLSSRINSTWGGGLVDMVRCEIILDVMEREGLVENAAEIGAYFLAGLEALGSRSSGVSNVRGRGLMCAFDCVDEAARDRLVAESFQSGVLILSAGERSVRFRPPLTLTRDEVDFGLERLEHALSRSA